MSNDKKGHLRRSSVIDPKIENKLPQMSEEKWDK